MDATNHILLGLLRRALFGCAFTFDASNVDWAALFKEAREQTVHLLVYDSLTAEERAAIPAETAAQWQIAALQTLNKNERLTWEQKKILASLQEAEIPCVLLKGSSCARNYPKPEMRCAGDIDLLLSREGISKAKALMAEMGFSASKTDHHCHVGMYRKDLAVELHFEPNGIPDGKTGEQLREFFAGAENRVSICDGLPFMPVCSEAVALLMHKLRHIVTGGLGLRQFCDWAVFVYRQVDAATWCELEPLLHNFGMLHFAKLATRLCVDYLGLPEESAPWCLNAEAVTARMLMEDLLRTGNFGHKEVRYGQRLFTDGGKGGRIASFFRVGVQACRENWAPCRENKGLLVVAPLVLLGRYCKQRRNGKRPPLRLGAKFRDAAMRQKLYRELRPFWDSEDKT